MYLPDSWNPACVPESVKEFIYATAVVFYLIAVLVGFREYRGERADGSENTGV